MVLVTFSVFLLVVLVVFLLVPLLLILLPPFPFSLQFSLVLFFLLSFFFFGVIYFLVLVFLLFLLFIFLLLCVLLLITYATTIFSFFACISFDCSCRCVFLLVPPLSDFFVPFFSPGSRVHLKRKTLETTSISFCLPLGELCKNILSHSYSLLFPLVDVFVGCSWEYVLREQGIYCCFFVIVGFGVWKRAFFRSNLSLVPAFFGTHCRLCSCSSYFLCFCLCVALCHGFCFLCFQNSSSAGDCLSFFALS